MIQGWITYTEVTYMISIVSNIIPLTVFKIFDTEVLWPRSRMVQAYPRSMVMVPIDSPWMISYSGCKILKCITWSWSRPFQERSVIRRLTIDIARKHTKFDDASFSRSEDISQGVPKCQKLKM